MKVDVSAIDVRNVANRINLAITDDQVMEVLEMYEGESENDPTGRWDSIVENCIYNVTQPDNPKWKYIGDECYDVTTSDGDVITVWTKTTPDFRD
jgi:fructose-1,6-bisphosphatase/inositol monophosphatase family enzyme